VSVKYNRVELKKLMLLLDRVHFTSLITLLYENTGVWIFTPIAKHNQRVIIKISNADWFQQ